MNIFAILNTSLTYHRFDVRIVANADAHFDAWIGAYLRNNLLYAAEQVMLPDVGISLFRYIETITIAEQHSLHKPLKEGFPRPYYLYLQSHNEVMPACTMLHANEVLCFSLVLLGNAAQYIGQFIEAIRLMCAKGMGSKLGRFTLVNVCEVSASGQRNVLHTPIRLHHATQLSDFMDCRQRTPTISIVFESPVCLLKLGKTKNTDLSYQDKSNAFPSFHQLIRSLAHRLMKLTCLYCKPHDMELYTAMEQCIEQYIQPSTALNLNYAQLERVSLQSTPKRDRPTRLPLSGYVGGLEFYGRYAEYLPMLLFMRQLGVGHELSYGLGKYEVND